jgi:MoaA/NifB/PqqE/SkfB family radical SAM enzyme
VRRDAGRDLGVEDWKKIIRNVSRVFAAIVFTGGEPLLYEGVGELIDHAHERAYVGMLTNGLLLDEEAAERCARLDYLNVSSGELFRRGGAETEPWASVLPRMQRRGTFVASTIVVTSGNVRQVPGVIETLTRLGVPAEVSIVHTRDGTPAHGFRTGDAGLGFDAPADLAALRALQDHLISMKRNGYLIHTPDSYITSMAGYAGHGPRTFRCFAGEKFICINNDGSLMPCQDLPPSRLNALRAGDVEQSDTLKDLVPAGCRCLWDCAYFYSLLDLRCAGLTVRELFAGAQNRIRFLSRHARHGGRHEL